MLEPAAEPGRVGVARRHTTLTEPQRLAVEVDEIVEIEGRGPFGWRFVEYSPFNPR